LRQLWNIEGEGRKRVILIAAAILASRKLAQQDSTRPSSATISAIHDAIVFAERIMQEIDNLYSR
jgi:hypothetical protein